MWVRTTELRRSVKRSHFFGVLEVLEEGILLPNDPFANVSCSVREALGLAGFPSKEPKTSIQS
jgi:hypothetical protein